ncbi:ABC transporter ATP-binding protein [Senegalimassilia anaerobia]|uniref:ABC transporter ATP-binding protein n=1 Tax=uncultured Senegalimassilia sp. TaxID=1714350 RepID=UPI0025DC60E5|nr:ATP-binding cassette domain-containing protein [uncultured Senegalimassilia sp.]
MRVEISHYTKAIKGITVLDDVNLILEPGTCYGLRGKNGSGKTMLMRAIAGLLFPTSGGVFVDGKKLGKDIDFPASVGLLIETPSFLPRYAGFKNLQLLAGLRGVAGGDDIAEALRRVGLDSDDKRPYRKYSLGMQQRLGIACAIMEHPDLILLDEPINALDPSGVARVETIVREEKERGAIVVVACHDAEELDLLADEIFVMAEGRLTSHEKAGG